MTHFTYVIPPGWPGLLLIVLFSLNAAYIGSRLGVCWDILSEKHSEFRQPHVRDPYPLIAEKAGLEKGARVAKGLRMLASACVALTLYGAAIVFIELIGSFMHDLTDNRLSTCKWIVIAAVTLTPLTWFGTPKDFWLVVVGDSSFSAAATLFIKAVH